MERRFTAVILRVADSDDGNRLRYITRLLLVVDCTTCAVSANAVRATHEAKRSASQRAVGWSIRLRISLSLYKTGLVVRLVLVVGPWAVFQS